jgi:hypothetical protein
MRPKLSASSLGPDTIQIGDELCEKEGIGYVECDLNECVEAKPLHDVVGGYQRYSILRSEDHQEAGCTCRVAFVDAKQT